MAFCELERIYKETASILHSRNIEKCVCYGPPTMGPWPMKCLSSNHGYEGCVCPERYQRQISSCRADKHNCVCNVYGASKKIIPWTYCRSTGPHKCACHKVFSRNKLCKAITHDSIGRKFDYWMS